MQRESDEEAWRTIVENYGDRVELDDQPALDPSAPPSDRSASEPPEEQRLERLFRPLPELPGDADKSRRADDPEDEFVPPPPPPLPKVPPDRLVAWSGLFGSPTVLLLCLVLGVDLAPWLGYLLVASFIGGFVYLVVHMPRGPADPWDDGARL